MKRLSNDMFKLVVGEFFLDIFIVAVRTQTIVASLIRYIDPWVGQNDWLVMKFYRWNDKSRFFIELQSCFTGMMSN